MVNATDLVDERILELLRDRAAPRSGQEMAAALGMSRVALWKRVERLRLLGFSIEASRRGYSLVGEDSVAPGPSEEAGSVVYLPRAASTMDEATALAEGGAPSGTLVIADEQEAGRGRLGREWRSPRGGLYLSLVLRPNLPATFSGALVLEALAAAAEAAGGRLEPRWPNDLFAAGRKAGGVLVESRGPPERPRWYVVGIGIDLEAVPVPGRRTAGLREAGAAPRRRELAGALRRRLSAWGAEPECRPGRWKNILEAHLSGEWRRLVVRDWRGRERRGEVEGLTERGGILLGGAELLMAETALARPAV